MCSITFSSSIVRSEDGERLAIIFRDSAGSGNTRGGWDFPATKNGLLDARAAIKNDAMTAAADYGAIDSIEMPEAGEESDEAELTGDGDA